MRLALDSNRYTDLCRAVEEITTLTEHAEAVFLPFVVLGELRAGFALGSRGAENERLLRPRREFLVGQSQALAAA